MVAPGVVDFCRARTKWKSELQASKDDRRELREASRSLEALLKESMLRNNVTAVRLDDGRVARLSLPARRACPVRTDEDVLSLIDDLARHLTTVPPKQRPTVAASVVLERARARGPPPPPPRVVLVRGPLKACQHDDPEGTATPSAPRETQTLGSEFARVQRTQREARDALAPLRRQMREAEAQCLAERDEAVTTVQVLRPDQSRVLLKVAPVEAPISTGVGIRVLVRVVREAVASGETTDAGLRARVLAGVVRWRLERQRPPPRLKVTETRA